MSSLAATPAPGRRHDLLDLSDDDAATLPALRRIFLRFCSFGRGHRVDVARLRMEGRAFVKFARDTGLLHPHRLSTTSVDLIFAKLSRATFKIDFEQFLVGLRHMAAHRGVAHAALVAFVLEQHGLAPEEEAPAGESPKRRSTAAEKKIQTTDATDATDVTTTDVTTPRRALRYGAGEPAPATPDAATDPHGPTVSATSPPTPRCAVVVVDMQVDFFSKNAAVSSAFPDLPQRMRSFLGLCRAAAPDVEVVHLREGSNARASPWYAFWQELNPGCDSAADPARPEPCAREVGGERVFVKLGYDGVGVDSGLEGYLRARGVSTVLVCGLVTSCCVHMNAAGLFLRGYRTFCVEDACGDRTQAMHTESLRREARRSYGVVGSEDLFASTCPEFGCRRALTAATKFLRNRESRLECHWIYWNILWQSSRRI